VERIPPSRKLKQAIAQMLEGYETELHPLDALTIVNCINHYNSLHWWEKVRPTLSKVDGVRGKFTQPFYIQNVIAQFIGLVNNNK
jgi:hypothetical protein